MSSGVEFLCLFNLIDIVRYGIGRSSVSTTPWNVAAWSKYLIRSLLHPARSVVISCCHCLRPLIEISAVSISWSHLSNSASIHRHHQPIIQQSPHLFSQEKYMSLPLVGSSSCSVQPSISPSLPNFDSFISHQQRSRPHQCLNSVGGIYLVASTQGDHRIFADILSTEDFWQALIRAYFLLEQYISSNIMLSCEKYTSFFLK